VSTVDTRVSVSFFVSLSFFKYCANSICLSA
jgi:hypothetical protein